MKKIMLTCLVFCAVATCLNADGERRRRIDPLARIGGFTGGGPNPQTIQTNLAVLSRNRAAMHRETLRRMKLIQMQAAQPVAPMAKPITPPKVQACGTNCACKAK